MVKRLLSRLLAPRAEFFSQSEKIMIRLKSIWQYWYVFVLLPFLMAADGPKPAISKLDAETKAKALAALAGLVILGLTMMVLVWLGARWTRRYMRSKFDEPRHDTYDGDDWTGKPLVTAKPNRSSDEKP